MAAESSEGRHEGRTPSDRPATTRPGPDSTKLGKYFFGPRAVSATAVTGLFVLGLIGFFYFAKPFLMPVVLALLLSFLLKPVVNAFCRVGVRRPIGAAIVLILFIGLISTGIYRLNGPAKEWLSKAPASVQAIETKGRDLLNRAERFMKRVRGIDDGAYEKTDEETRRADAKRLASLEKMISVGAILGYTAGFITSGLETLVLLFFLLASGDLLMQKLVHVLPKMHEKKEAVEITREVEHNISTFLFTITIVNTCVALVVAMTMLLLGMPNPVLWGVIAGLLNFIPYFGPFSVVLVLVLAGFLSFESTLQALLPATIYFCIHAIESNLITPTVLGRRLTLSPVVIFVSLMFWTWLWGVPGALLAVPLLMTFKIFCDHFKPLAPIGEFLSG